MTSTVLTSANHPPPLIVHVIQRLAVGGLENGLVNLINQMPKERYRHAVICLTQSTEFKNRIKSKDVRVIELHKAPGHELRIHLRLGRILSELKADIVHTRNLAALEFQLVAALAGVKARIHGEHGRDVYDLDGRSRKYNALRKAMRPFVQHYTAVSRDLQEWLIHTIGIDPGRVTQIQNGVGADRFHPRRGPRDLTGPPGFMTDDSFVIGTIGRMEPVKDQVTLVRAFIYLLNADIRARQRLRLLLVGDGSLRAPSLELLRSAGAERLAWLPGDRDDVAEMMRALDIFVLPSLREGISNTILEAMASGLPVVATRVGGNPELIADEVTGTMVPPADPVAMAEAIRTYLLDPQRASLHGQAGRRRVESGFSMEAMVGRYLSVYDSVLSGRAPREDRADREVRYS
jgi:sugar transferase (PEP-CTERM/EpsH1 system associated)